MNTEPLVTVPPGTPVFRVRPMRLGDVAAAERLQQLVFPYDRWTADALRESLALGADRWWVIAENLTLDAVARGALLGVAGVSSGEVADVLSLAVDPVAQRRGVGRALLEELLAQARAWGADRLLLEVEEANAAARALYASAGFTPVSRRAGYYGGPDGPGTVDALVLGRATVRR